ncbi:MAG: APC family permease [Phycisphaerales bacterium]
MAGAPRARLGVWSLALLVVASMIGAGVFTTSGFALADLGTPARVLGAWAVGGVIALCGAIAYGALARRMTESGGEYLFLSRAVHPGAGFVAGWVSLLAGFTGAIAFAATAFESYALPDGVRPAWLPEGAVAIGVILACALLHGVRVTPGVVSQNAKVAIKLGLLVAFLAFAATTLGDERWPGGPLRHDAGDIPGCDALAFATSVMWISLSYSGFNAAIYIAGEAHNPARTVPRAMALATLGVALLYLALNAVFVLAPAPERIAGREDVATVAARAVGGDALAEAARWVIALALVTSVSSMIMTGPRVYAKMAEDRLFLPGLDRVVASPLRAVWLQAALACVVAAVSELQQLLSYLGFTLGLSTAAAVASVFLLKRRDPAMRAPGFPIVHGAYVLATLVFATLAAMRRPWEAGAAVATIASGLALYWLVRARQSTGA